MIHIDINCLVLLFIFEGGVGGFLFVVPLFGRVGFEVWFGVFFFYDHLHLNLESLEMIIESQVWIRILAATLDSVKNHC